MNIWSFVSNTFLDCILNTPGFIILLLFFTAVFFPRLFTSYGQKEMFEVWETPSASHLLGTNALGYDVFTEIIYGTKDTLIIGLSSSILALLLGALMGMAAAGSGLFGGPANGLINLFILLPRLITVIVLSAFIGENRAQLILLIALFSWGTTARAIRAQVQHLKAMPFIEACRIQGFSGLHISLHHILPNLKDILFARFLLGVNSCIMMESTLSFLGMGDLYHPTWGTMINFAYKRGAFLRHAYAYLLVPGLCILLLSISFYLISLYVSEKGEAVL